MIYKKLRIVYFLERFLKYNFKNPLFWLVSIDWILTKIIINTWLWHEHNIIVSYLWYDFTFLLAVVIVSLMKKWTIIYWVNIVFFIYIIIRHILILCWFSITTFLWF